MLNLISFFNGIPPESVWVTIVWKQLLLPAGAEDAHYIYFFVTMVVQIQAPHSLSGDVLII